jgi:hypothetical protein
MGRFHQHDAIGKERESASGDARVRTAQEKVTRNAVAGDHGAVPANRPEQSVNGFAEALFKAPHVIGERVLAVNGGPAGSCELGT